MNGDKEFDSQVRVGKRFATYCSNDEIKNEPMFFNSDMKYGLEHGGPITKSFLMSLPEHWKSEPLVFDSRVHMLMPGWFPAIPGFHHDDVPRPEIPVGQHFATAGQPDYDNPRYLSEHIIGLVNAEVCPTEFALGNCFMNAVPDGEVVYRQWHKEVEALLAKGQLTRFVAPDRTLIQFDWQTFHSGTKAVRNGWRWFGRVSRNTDRVKTITNEIRRNAQVYLEFPMEGW